MDRRKFLKSLAVAGVATTLDFSFLGKVLATGQTQVQKTADLVAVMGGEPGAMLDRMLAEFGGIGKFVSRGDTVVLKPNIGWDKAPEMAANTNPQLVAAMVRACLGAGAGEVLVFDHTCENWTRCYETSGIKKAVEAAGGKMLPGNDESYYVEQALPRGSKLKSAKIHKALVDCDVWFNMPVLKTHGGAKLTMAMKNYMGIVWDRVAFHNTDLQQCIADVATFGKRPALHIVDAYRVMKDNGPQGKSLEDVALAKGLFASPDPVAVDTAAGRFFNQIRTLDLSTVTHIAKAEALKVGTTNLDALNIRRVRM
ncbi:MAG: DUF362 domain-containing protein [Rikenellaceae bacterium]|nr:DUF362 domain-containing protein [Rikenellaceae bacterium]